MTLDFPGFNVYARRSKKKVQGYINHARNSRDFHSNVSKGELVGKTRHCRWPRTLSYPKLEAMLSFWGVGERYDNRPCQILSPKLSMRSFHLGWTGGGGCADTKVWQPKYVFTIWE